MTFERHWPGLERYALAATRRLARAAGLAAEDLEDIVQEARIALYRAIVRWTGPAPCDPAVRLRKGLNEWLHGVLHKKMLTLQRQRARRPEASLSESLGELDAELEGLALERLLGDGGAAAGAMLEAADLPRLQADLEAGLATLTPVQREVLVLVAFDGCSERAAADALQVPRGTVKSRLHSARQALARYLRQCGWEISDV